MTRLAKREMKSMQAAGWMVVSYGPWERLRHCSVVGARSPGESRRRPKSWRGCVCRVRSRAGPSDRQARTRSACRYAAEAVHRLPAAGAGRGAVGGSGPVPVVHQPVRADAEASQAGSDRPDRRWVALMPALAERVADVKGSLTPDRLARPVVENDGYAAFARRVLRAAGRRVAAGDVDGLADLVALSDEVERSVREAVGGLRTCGYSWGEVAARVGVTRQAAQQRWGSPSAGGDR